MRARGPTSGARRVPFVDGRAHCARQRWVSDHHHHHEQGRERDAARGGPEAVSQEVETKAEAEQAAGSSDI